MSIIRIPGSIYAPLRAHLSPKGYVEHFAFLFAKWEQLGEEHVFLVQDVHLVKEANTSSDRFAWEVAADDFVEVVNRAIRGGYVVIEAHNHGGPRPRFSRTDERGLAEFVDYMHSSIPGRPYVATVWGDETAYAEIFLPDGTRSPVRSIVADGAEFRQVVSRDDDNAPIDQAFSRQLEWLGERGQREMGRIRVAIVGLGGTGSQMAVNLAYLGVRDFVPIDFDPASKTNGNRLVTAGKADVGRSKVVLATERILSIAPTATIRAIETDLRDPQALAALKEVDLIFGCLDNDGGRLILDELARAYHIPYFDLGVGIDCAAQVVEAVGGRLAVSLPNGPCLTCMDEIDKKEAHYFLETPEARAQMVRLGYVNGLDVPSPSVVSLNAIIAGMASTEFLIYCSGVRHANPLTLYDALGTGRSVKSHWAAPQKVKQREGCYNCSLADQLSSINIDRYAVRQVLATTAS